MTDIYKIPNVSGMLLIPGYDRTRGTFRELLTKYSTLGPADRKRSSILLDEPIPTPPVLRKLDSKNTRLNIFDGEGEALLRFL